jgi:hypothetical protein
MVGLKQATIEAKIILAHILRQFWVTTSQRAEDIQLAYETVSMPHPKLQLKFTKRSHYDTDIGF